MRIGAALALLTVGAVLRFATATTSTHGFNVQVVGDIMMAMGVLGLILWLVVWAPWVRSIRREYPARLPVDEEDLVRRREPAYRRSEHY
jgi:hypothetical protein